jgi:hypothetical protein
MQIEKKKAQADFRFFPGCALWTHWGPQQAYMDDRKNERHCLLPVHYRSDAGRDGHGHMNVGERQTPVH